MSSPDIKESSPTPCSPKCPVPEYDHHLFLVHKSACEWPSDIRELQFPAKIMEGIEAGINEKEDKLKIRDSCLLASKYLSSGC